MSVAAADAPSRRARGLRLSLFWRVQLVAWSFISLITLIGRLVIYRDLGVAVGITLLLEPLLILLAAGLRGAYDRLGFAGRLTPRATLAVLLLSGLAALVVVAVSNLVRVPLGWEIPHWDTLQSWLALFGYYLLVYIGWSLGYFWVIAELAARSERQRATAAEAEALRTELRELRLQLDPHFLFNALNGIATEIPEQPEAALAMLHALSDYLRYSLSSRDVGVAPVSAEAAAAGAYLEIQRARFGPRLEASIEVEPGIAPWPIASFLLQPLVENAVKHGARGPLDLTVALRRQGEALLVTVENAGRIASGPPQPDSGLGLVNLRRRLALHYPGRHRFTLVQAGERVRAELLLEGEPCSGS